MTEYIVGGEAKALDLDNPLLEHLGVRLLEWTPGYCALTLDIESRHLNRQASLQGGVIATLLDSACGYAGLKTSANAAVSNAVTVMLTQLSLFAVPALAMSLIFKDVDLTGLHYMP